MQSNSALPPEQIDALSQIIGLLIIAPFVLGLLVATIFYYLTLSKALERCRPENREMEPGSVWLNLIPCFYLVWMFITVTRVSDSLSKEFHARGIDGKGDCGKSLGIIYCVLVVCGLVPIPLLQLLPVFAWIVCWIVFWVKIAGLSRELHEDERAGSPGLLAEGAGGRFGERRQRRARDDEDDYDDRDDDRYRAGDPDDRTRS